MGEMAGRPYRPAWLVGGPSRALERCLSRLAGRLADASVFGLGLAGLASLALWSVAGIWRFPAALPASFSLASWRVGGVSGLAAPTCTTLAVGVLAAVVALDRCRSPAWSTRLAPVPAPEARVLALVYLPLLVPQIASCSGCRCCSSGSVSTGR